MNIKIKIIDIKEISEISEIEIEINNNVISYKRLLNVLLNLKNKNELLNFYMYKNYQYDISFLKCNLTYFYENKNKIEIEIKNLIENEIKNININENDNELFNEFQYTLSENENEIIHKHNNFNVIKFNEINNKKIDFIENDIDLIINYENKINFRFKNLISTLIKNRKIGNLNKLLFNFKLRNIKLYENDKKKIIKIRLFILNLIENNQSLNNKDIYYLKDYYELDYENEFNSLYDYEILKDNYEIDIKGNFYINEYKEIENKNDIDLIKLVYSLH